MVVRRFWQSHNSHVAISDGFYLEDSATLGYSVKRIVNALQERKYLSRIANRTPCGESANVYVVIAKKTASMSSRFEWRLLTTSPIHY